MLLNIENHRLQLTVDTHGAQMMSLLGDGGCEYLWQGDPAYWSGRAPVLFPIIGRLEGKQYQVDGRTYSMGIHGFASGAEFAVLTHTQDTLILGLQGPQDQYPFDFALEITYRLTGSTLAVESRVVNRGESVMHFALGGHPGFRVPLEQEERFEDYSLEFSQCCSPDRIGFTADTVLLSGQNRPYPLEDGKRLPLRHELFDDDAIILQNMARKITLKSQKSRRSVTVSYPDMPYLGIWHWPKKAAPYVCIEPWTSLPGRSGVTEDIACRSDFIHLAPGKTWENIWTITVQ